MKTKIVLWGSGENDEKLLIAIELLDQENKIRIHTFLAEKTTEEFYNQMMNLWRNGGQVIFPEHHKVIERELSVSEPLLPDHIKVERTDLINRAKTEWHFVVLSAKLHQAYVSELEEFQERIRTLIKFDNNIWEEMKSFWSKVQTQVHEKNLFKEHSDELRSKTNELFTKMKELKRSMDEEFAQFSTEQVDLFFEKLNKIEKKIEEGLGLQPIFNELKNIQKKFRDTNFTRSDRSKVWKKLDGAFKKVKEKKFGSRTSERSSLDRINRRYNGLIAAINKMKNSISRDKKEMDFQTSKIESTDGQLEMQIRQAKLSMIEERIRSKEEKLNEMLKTKIELEKKIEIEEQKAKRRSQEPAAEPAKENAKEEGDSQTEEKNSDTGESEDQTGENTEEKPEEDASKVHAGERTEGKPEEDENKDQAGESKSEKKDDSMTEAIASTLGESISDVVNTAKAIAGVVADKIEDSIEKLTKSEEEE